MSSVQSFIRQIPLSTTYYNASSGVTYYQFNKSGSNYVGNYPPGYMTTIAGLGASLPAGAVLRDMGKTFQAYETATPGASDKASYFRQVQVIVPAGFVCPILGGTGANTWGVVGSPEVPSTAAPYYTVYVKTTVAGLGVNSGLTPIIGGQM